MPDTQPKRSVPVLARLGVAAAFLVAGCASHPPVLDSELAGGKAPPAVELRETPFFPQEKYQCGPASLATALSQSGIPVSPADLVRQIYIPGRQGSLQVEMLAASRRHGRVPYVVDPTVQALLAELEAGRPVLVLQNLGLRSYPIWHYAVVIGYSLPDDQVILRSGTVERATMPAKRFLRTWDGANRWGMVVLRPGELPALPERKRYIESVAAMERVAEPQALRVAYRGALVQWPDDPTARFGMANALHSLGQLEAAEAMYRALLAAHPGHKAALNNLAEVLADRGCFPEALATIDAALATEAETGPLHAALRATRTGILSRQSRAVLPPPPAAHQRPDMPCSPARRVIDP